MRHRHLPAVVFLTCVLAAPLSATVLLPAEFREIVNGSEIIAYGRVVEAVPQWSDDRTHVDTFVTLAVSTYLKGDAGASIVFKVPGGQVGRYRNVFVGAPIFEVGDEAVVFLKLRDGDSPSLFGLNQGVFRVRLDARTQRRIVVPPALLGRGESPEPVIRGSAERRSVPLETFGAQVQTVMTETARGVR